MRAYRVLMVLAGVGVLFYGLYGLVSDPQIDEPGNILAWAAGAVLIHDGLWLPLVCLVGAPLARSTAVRSGLIAAASVTVVALPLVLREDDDHGNPTLLPLPYRRDLLLILGCCAAVTGVLWALRRRRPSPGSR